MQYRHDSIPWKGRPVRIMQVSDVHFSALTGYRKNQKISQEIVSAADLLLPDIIAVTGDLISRAAGETSISDAAALVRRLRKRAEVYYIMGNHEVSLPRHKRRLLLSQLADAGAVLLNNRTAFSHGNFISGLVMPAGYYRRPEGGYRALPVCTAQDIYRRLGSPAPNTILLAHNPLWLPAYAQWGAKIVLSGHVHGGVIRLPLLGGVFSPERKLFPEYTKGLYTLGTAHMSVSAGIGKLRIGNPPEIVLITLGRNEK